MSTPEPSLSTSTTSFPLLVGTEDYPRWALNVEAELMEHNCHGALLAPTPTTQEAAVQYFASGGYGPREITSTMTSTWMEKKKEREQKAEASAVGILRKRVAQQNKQATLGKSAHEIWTMFESEYKDLSPWCQMEGIRKAHLIHMSNFANATLYCNAFHVAFDEMCGMILPNSLINQKGIEGILFGVLIANTTDRFMPIVASLRAAWTLENTNLKHACTEIQRYERRIETAPTTSGHNTPRRSRRGGVGG